MKPNLVLVLCLCVLTTAAHASEIVLTNGDRLTGSLVSLDASALVLDTEWGGRIVVQREFVSGIDGGEELVGAIGDAPIGAVQLSLGDSGVQRVETDEGLREVPLEEVSELARPNEKDSGLDLWDASVTYGLNISSGNSDARSHALRANATTRRDRLRHTGEWSVDRQEDDGDVSADQMRIRYRLDAFLSDRLFAFGNVDHFQDDLRDIDHRVTLGAGLGYQIRDDALETLSVRAGATAVFEEQNGRSETDPAGRLSLDYSRKWFGGRLEFAHDTEVLVFGDRDRGEIVTSSTGARFFATERISTDLRLDLRHETEPGPGREKTDLTWILGLGLSL